MELNVFKETILSYYKRDPYHQAVIEKFFDNNERFYTENDMVTNDNYNIRYNRWIKSNIGHKACEEVFLKVYEKEEVIIQRGLTSIERGKVCRG